MIDDLQRQHLRHWLENGLPLTSHPYRQIADRIGSTEEEVLAQIRQWDEEGLFRRHGLVVNHRALGYHANAMLVLDIDDDRIRQIGLRLADESVISLCYQRPRRPGWPYNLFCMIHGRERQTVERVIADLLARHDLQDAPRQILFSRRAFKQCGARYTAAPASTEACHG